jgi:hypothetical protein
MSASGEECALFGVKITQSFLKPKKKKILGTQNSPSAIFGINRLAACFS